jgi:hypothetical protein
MFGEGSFEVRQGFADSVWVAVVEIVEVVVVPGNEVGEDSNRDVVHAFVAWAQFRA